MDPANYYITTLVNAFKNLAPVIAFIVGGYFIFIKMPFLFLKKSMDDQKKKLGDDSKDLKVQEEKYSVDDYLKFQKQMKLLNGGKADSEEKKKEEPKKESQKKTEQKKQESKREPPKRPASSSRFDPYEVLGLKSGETLNKSELKKRYFELLKQNHPDRVASMGHDFKKLAEKNTKDINKAYEELKKKAA